MERGTHSLGGCHTNFIEYDARLVHGDVHGVLPGLMRALPHYSIVSAYLHAATWYCGAQISATTTDGRNERLTPLAMVAPPEQVGT